MPCSNVGIDTEACVTEVLGQRIEYIGGKFYPAMATRESLFDLSCEGEQFVVIAPSGVAHRSPYVIQRTLCGIDYPPSWRPASALTTCARCIAASR